MNFKYTTMRTLFLLCGFALLCTSCSNHSLAPEYDCMLPQPSNITVGSYWVYLRTNLDSTGNAITGTISYDTLTVLDKSTTASSETMLKVQEHYSNDFGKTWKSDTSVWVFTATQFKVTNLWFQESCNCFNGLLKFRLYEDCSVDAQTIANETVPGDDLPSLVVDSNGKQTVVTTKTVYDINNTYKTISNENVSVAGKAILTKKSASNIGFVFHLVSPDKVTFAVNGKRSITQRDERIVWTNKDIGIIKERSIISEDSYGDGRLPKSFERVLVSYQFK